VALSRILLAQHRPGDAQALLSRMVVVAQNDGRDGSLIQLLTLQAVAYQAQAKTDHARVALERALSLAEPEGYVRTFVDMGLTVARMLSEIKAEGGRMAEYAARLLMAFPDLSGEIAPIQAESAPTELEPLSDRELQVLRMIAAGSSNRAIADELVVALGTVTAHTATIYRKLGVHNRTHAAARARELGLIA
jgi:LuxR family maltose regulon positive regulatory protein